MRQTSAALVLLSAIGLAALTGCTSTGAPATPGPSASTSAPVSAADCDGVGIIVDAGDLAASTADPSVDTCVETDTAIGAADALAEAGVTTEGTEQWGDQVVCRVGGEPSSETMIPAPDGTDYVETCTAMPAEFAYWSIWTQPAGGEWAYATEGLPTLQLQPGDKLALLFQIDGEPAAPES